MIIRSWCQPIPTFSFSASTIWHGASRHIQVNSHISPGFEDPWPVLAAAPTPPPRPVLKPFEAFLRYVCLDPPLELFRSLPYSTISSVVVMVVQSLDLSISPLENHIAAKNIFTLGCADHRVQGRFEGSPIVIRWYWPEAMRAQSHQQLYRRAHPLRGKKGTPGVSPNR